MCRSQLIIFLCLFDSVGIQIIYIVSMLQPIPASQAITSKDAYFYDTLNKQLFYLQYGTLNKKDLSTQRQQIIQINLSSIDSIPQSMPSIITSTQNLILNVNCNVATMINDQEVTLRISREVTDGSFWEWHMPLTLQGIQLGICKMNNQSLLTNDLISFNSSTARTVSFVLKGKQLIFWVNGTHPLKNSSKTLKIDTEKNQKIYPCATLKGKGSLAAFMPFFSQPELLGISEFNPFGQIYSQVPLIEQPQAFQQPKSKISKLIQLSNDRLLIVWQNNLSRIYYRSRQSLRFEFNSAGVHERSVKNLFSTQQYNQLKAWRDNQSLFSLNGFSSTKNAFQWIRYLISQLDQEQSKRTDLYKLLLTKLLVLRPYLNQIGVQIPNLIQQSQVDKLPFKLASKYFNRENKNEQFSIIKNYEQFKIEGNIKDYTQNYLISQNQHTFRIYYIGDNIKQVTSFTSQNLSNFTKRDLLEKFKESDLSYFKSQSTFLFKILMGCLNKEKKAQETHAVNQNDLNELIKDFGIKEQIARAALIKTGHIEEALVWIYTVKQQQNLKKLQNMKEQNAFIKESVSILELKSTFCRLVLLLNGTIYILGMLPCELKRWIYRGENEFIDLTSFKHENNLSDINLENQFRGINHAPLAILDKINAEENPILLFSQNSKIFGLYSGELGYLKREININFDNILQAQSSLSYGEKALKVQILQNNLLKTVKGELITSDFLNRTLLQCSTAFINNKLYTNQSLVKQQGLKIVAQLDLQLNIQQGEAEAISLKVLNGPPGINKNYLISSILLPKSKFLANYPHGFSLSHLHNKLIRPTTIQFKRSISQKNINYITGGSIHLIDIWGRKSQQFLFKFQENAEQIVLNFPISEYWSKIIVKAKYTDQKKLPFQIGTVLITGHSVSEQSYRKQYYQHLTKILSSLKTKLSIINYNPINSSLTQIIIASNSLKSVEDALKASSLNIKSQKYVVIERQYELQTLDSLEPVEIIKKIVAEHQKAQTILRQLANSYLFNLNHFKQQQVYKFVDLVLYYSNNIESQNFYERMFQKIWENDYGQKYLNKLANSLTEIPIIPLAFLKILIKKINSNELQQGIKSALKSIAANKSSFYSKLKSNEQIYLYYETEFYSNYYYGLIEPSIAQNHSGLYTEPLIKSQIAVLKSEFTRRAIVKLPAQYYITGVLLKVQRSETLSKFNYSINALNSNKKQFIGEGRVYDHQWTELTRFSSKTQVQQIYKQSSKNFNSLGLILPAFKAQYIEIQFNFTQTGIIAHNNQIGKVPQVDILPELYGFQINKSVDITTYDWIFNNKAEDMFFLSVSNLGKVPLQKYSVTKGKNIQFLYYDTQKEDLGLIRKTLQEKIQKNQLDSIVTLQKKLIKNGSFSHKISLDYLYTLFILISGEILKREEKLSDSICQDIYNTIVLSTQGPIKIAGFKALSHKIPLLLKSLQYIESELLSLGAISCSYEQLLQVLDFNNADLCKSLSRLILRGVAYEQKWVQLLIKLSNLAQNHRQIIYYFIKKEDWLQNNLVLDYIFNLPYEIFIEHFLGNISYNQLCKLVLTPNAKSQLQMLLEVIVERASSEHPLDLDVVSLLFQQQEVRWEQLERVIVCYPQATDMIIHQYLQTDTPEKLASNHYILLSTSAQPKYAQEFADFLDRIYKNNKRALGQVFTNLIGICTSLHYDFLETITNFIVDLCDYGGVQGVILTTQTGLLCLNAAVQMLKVVQNLPQDAILPNEDLLIRWFLRNNDYQFANGNPANKSAGYHLMRSLVEHVLSLLKTSSPVKALNKYTEQIKLIQQSRRHSLVKKHLFFNQVHHGATQLLSNTLTPGSLGDVLVGSQNPLLTTVISQLKASTIKKSRNADKWKPNKEIDITEKFTIQDAATEIKDIQLGKVGSKSPAYKIPITTKFIRFLAEEVQHPSKFVIGFVVNDHLQNKTAVFPSKVQLISGNGKATVKVGEMSLLDDEFFLQFGVKVFGLNLNSIDSFTINSVKSLQFRFHQPNFASASDLLESGQKFKKGSTFSISFVGIFSYDQQPTQQPDYSHLHVTLLGFLGQKKYHRDLKAVLNSPQFDQKLQLIIQVLNDLLPNESIQNLLLALNRQGENILQHILKSKNANPRLVSMLVLGRLTKESINKLIAYTLENMSAQFVNIVIQSLRLASYSHQQKETTLSVSNFQNLKLLIEKWQKVEGQLKKLYLRLMTSITTVPSIYNYEIGKLIDFIWGKSDRQKYYLLLAAILPYYPVQLKAFATKGYTNQIFEQLITVLKTNQQSQSIINEPYNYIAFLCILVLQSSSKKELLEKKAAIQIVQLLKSQTSLLIQYQNKTMKLFLNFFQSTCIGTCCQQQFGQILISLMTSLNDFNPTYHHYFIHSFFFPLINAFKGVPVVFVWKYGKTYLKQINDLFRDIPIKSNINVIKYQDDYYHPVETLDNNSLTQTIIFQEKESEKIIFKLTDGVLVDVVANKPRKFSSNEGKIVVETDTVHNLTISNDKYTAYLLNEWQKYLLTNATLINLDNPWILQESYRSVLAIQQSTPQRCYFLPVEMKLSELFAQINVGGLTIRGIDFQNIVPFNRHNGNQVSLSTTLKDMIDTQEQSYLKLQIQAQRLFENTTIQSLVKEEPVKQSFIARQTIFKAFEEKKGLEKMITVLKGCVKNWTNNEQSNIWGQYLKQLESYSCFPVFSSLYMTKQANVGLLFDLLLGLPDKQDSKKWSQKQKQSVKDLYLIIKDVFAVKGEQAKVVRQYALKSGFYSTMLDRLHIITKQSKRFKNEDKIEEQEFLPVFEKKQSQDEVKKTLTKKKGVGYGTDSSTNQKWDLTGHQEARKQKSEQILGLLKILEQFLDNQEFLYPPELLNQTLESSLLPIIESSLRGGSLLQISKYAQLFQGELAFIQVLARCKNLIPTLMPIPKCYEPKQIQSIHSLLKTLANTSKIFLSCLTGSASEKVSQEIAKKTIETFEIIEQAIESYEVTQNDEQEQKKILQLPLAKKYPLLMKDLRFDYIDMKDSTGKISKHHYSSSYQAGHKPPVQKTIRLAQELADISHALPIDHTNAIYVRCDKERVDFMQALIMGSNGTPYGHGAYLFDIHFQDNYPNGPPKVNLTTTGNGQIRFNPNLYACGKVCLSLLGTWRGNATENWDAKVSTLLQVLVSIQSIIMSEDIYFNEPGFQHQQGTPQGEKKNQAYANIVRYGNVKFAMADNIKNPPKGFESVIRRHFYLKKDQIMEQCRKWIKLAEKREASYNGLVNDHNYNWCNNFKKSKTEYKTMLEKAVMQLQTQLNKLSPPSQEDFKKQSSPTKQKKKINRKKKENENQVQLQEIDVSYGGAKQFEELDINDQRVKDRWSRYIGAMGVEAVSKQSKANILLLGVGPVGVQIAKNIVLSGCRELALWDDKVVDWPDLSGQFFLTQSDVGNSRLESTFYKLQELNHYVKLSKFDYNISEFSNISRFQVVVATERNHQELLKLNAFCRSNKIHFLSVDCYGPYGQIFNDFGDSFEILDKNGQETTEVILEDISIGEKGIVKLPKGHRHPYQDGETVRIAGVKGMKSLNNQNSSINGTLYKIRVIDQNSFQIGDTSSYAPYQGDGTARNLKTPTLIAFKSLQVSAQLQNIDSNLQFYDWQKSGKLKLLHSIFIALSQFRKQKNRLPLVWNKEDANLLVQQVKKIKSQLQQADIKYIHLFSYTCSGNFGSICAFFGGLASQEAFKAITGKYAPINQYFLAEFSQILETLPENQENWNEFLASYQETKDRREGLRRIIGADLLKKLQNAKVFMIGSGAIGCQLLKNFAMLQIGTGENGNIVVTDPDHIQTSNLNRQFLFRQKHIRKPKSATAIAVVSQMNPRLKGHVKARLDKVCEATKDIFTNEFFQSQTIIANALDNVQARRYVDSRCVQNKVPLLQSGTLSSKGHVQVIIPYKTETYASKQDPNDAQGDIPQCTLKMFPQQTLHCVEWARDLFGKQFTLGPKALRKLLQQGQKYVPSPSDIPMLKDCLKLIHRRPATFDDAIEIAVNLFYQLFRNDILQLLYTYPLDAKTKDGKPFWKLPKRPPVSIEQIFPEDPLHSTFITSFSVLLARVYNVPYPKDFRDPKKRQQIAKIASRIKVEPFVPSDKLAQQMASEVNKEGTGEQKEEKGMEEAQNSDQSQTHLYDMFVTILSELKINGETIESRPEQFQKDQDQNGHIDLIYSMANLRARNYKLQEMEWINVKLKAGRIMPALSTTTSCIAALQTIELVKYLRGCPLEAMRNAFINLAVPYMQLGQPGPVEKIKVHQNLETTLWERWSVGPISSSKTLGEMMALVEEKYGITIKGLSFTGGSQIYSDFVYSLQSKKEEKEKLLSKKLQIALSEQLGEQVGKFADFTLVMGVGQNLIKHAPTLRLLIEP